MIRGYRIWRDRISTSYGTQPTYTRNIDMVWYNITEYCTIVDGKLQIQLIWWSSKTSGDRHYTVRQALLRVFRNTDF